MVEAVGSVLGTPVAVVHATQLKYLGRSGPRDGPFSPAINIIMR
jgi:hypothetical protein